MTSEYIKLSASSLPRSQQHQKQVKICRPWAEAEEIICINEINKGSYSGYSMMGINWSISMATGQTSPADEHHEMWLKALKLVFRSSFVKRKPSPAFEILVLMWPKCGISVMWSGFAHMTDLLLEPYSLHWSLKKQFYVTENTILDLLILLFHSFSYSELNVTTRCQ